MQSQINFDRWKNGYKRQDQRSDQNQESSAERHFDAAESERELMYQKACNLMLSQKIKCIENAMNLFESLKDYKDSSTKVGECRELLSNIRTHEKKITALLIGITVIIFIIVPIIIILQWGI